MIVLFSSEKSLHVTDVYDIILMLCNSLHGKLAFDPIMVDNYAVFINCTPMGRASYSYDGPD